MAEILTYETFNFNNGEILTYRVEITREMLAAITDDDLHWHFGKGSFVVENFEEPSDECRAVVDCKLRRRFSLRMSGAAQTNKKA